MQVVSVLNMSNENVFHKKDAIKAIESKKFESHVKEKYVKFLNSWINEKERRADGVYSHNGIKIYKKRLSNKDRMLFSWVTCSDYNQGNPFLLIYAIIFDHDSVNSYLGEKLDASINDFETNLENARIEPQQIESFAHTIGNGPTKPLPGRINLSALDDLDMPHNIALDEHQRRAIVENQPLLIDGLAGTGKTAVLSRRAAFRAGYAKSNSKILMLSSNNGVVKRLLQDVSNLAKNEQYWQKNNREFSHSLITISFQDNQIPDSTEVGIDEASSYHKFDFDEILLDECQDVTPLEFEVLKIFVKFNDVRRYSFGGDPLQTLNPTGFDWGRIKSLFVNSIGKNKSESELRSIARGIKISKFHQNYRSQGDIVSLANAIQRHRSRAVSSDDLIEMIPHHPGSQPPQLLQINPKSEEDVSAVTKALLESGLGRVTAICWATDDHEVIKLCTGDNSDEILQQVWDTKQKENKFEDTDFRTALELHSSASIKGGEKHAVLLYKFGSSHENKLDSLLRDFEGLTPVNHLEKIPVSYAYSRLYVAVTRAFKKVYFVEDKDGIEFWNNVRLLSESGSSLFSYAGSASQIENMEDFILEDDLTKELFDDHLLNWNNNQDKNSLFSAIRILRHLIAKNKASEHDELVLYELEGDKALFFDDDEDTAIRLYKTARKRQKYMPLMFRKKMWAELRDLLIESGDSFDQALWLYCEIQLSNNIFDKIDLDDFVKIINNQHSRLVIHWRTELDTMEKFVDRLKTEFLNKYPKLSADVAVLVDGYFEFFGWTRLLEFMKKVADNNPRKYIEFVDDYGPKNNHSREQDRKYTSSLEKVRDQLSGDEKIDFIKDHIRWVTPDKKEEWNRVHAIELDLKITELPEKGFSSTIKDVPSFLVNDENNPTSKLFMLLDEIHGLIGQSAFNNDYSRRIELIIQARNETHAISQFQKIREALSFGEREGKLLRKDQSNYTQLNWIDFTTIANWLNKTRQNEDLLNLSKLDLNESLNLTKFDSVKLFLELCLEISKEYKDRGIFRRVEIFNEPVEAMSRLANSPNENDNKNSSKDVRFRVFDILAPQITGAIKAKRGGDSYKKLIELINELLINFSLSHDWERTHVTNHLKQVKSVLSKPAKSNFDLLLYRTGRTGSKLEKELLDSEEPINNPNLDKFVELLRKAGHAELADRYEQRKMTDVKTVQREIRASVNLQATISALNKGKRGIGDYSFLTLELFKDILEKIAIDKDQIFQIPNKEETIQKFWNEFLSLSKENEFELTSKLLAGLEPQTYIHAFSFVSTEIMLLCMMRDGLREPETALQNSFTQTILIQSQTVQVATGSYGKLTPAKQKKYDSFLADCEHFEGLKFKDKTKLNDEVVAFLLIQRIAKKAFTLDRIKPLCELIGAKKTGKKADLIVGLCAAAGMSDEESYKRLIGIFGIEKILDSPPHELHSLYLSIQLGSAYHACCRDAPFFQNLRARRTDRVVVARMQHPMRKLLER